MKKISVLLLLPLLFSCTNQGAKNNSSPFYQAKGLYDRQWAEHKDDARYMVFIHEWLAFKNNNPPRAEEGRCYYLSDKSERFILVQDQHGVINKLIAENENKKTKCFRAALVGKKYPKPPIAPFYHELTMAAP